MGDCFLLNYDTLCLRNLVGMVGKQHQFESDHFFFHILVVVF